MTEIKYGSEKFPVYLAEPAGPLKGGVVVIHEVWGLTDHIKSVADRLAAEGYVVLAPDLLSETDVAERAAPLQVDLFNPEKRNEAQPKLREVMTPLNEPGFAVKTIGKLKVCVDELYAREDVGQKVAVGGFCFGGSYSFNLAMNEPRLRAAVAFYGHATTDKNELQKIVCPVQAFYGENDRNLVDSLPELEKAMQTAGVDFEHKVYQSCGHAFFNDTNPYAYNEPAARDAWQRTLKFLATTSGA